MVIVVVDFNFTHCFRDRQQIPLLILREFKPLHSLNAKESCHHIETSQMICSANSFNPLSAKFIKWSNTLKQIVGKLPTICLSVFDHFSGLAFKGLILVSFELNIHIYIYAFWAVAISNGDEQF